MRYSVALLTASLVAVLAAPIPEPDVVMVTQNVVVTDYAEATVTAAAVTQTFTGAAVTITETAGAPAAVQTTSEAPAPVQTVVQTTSEAPAPPPAPATTSSVVVSFEQAAPSTTAAPTTTSAAIQAEAAQGWTSTWYSAWTSTIEPTSTAAAATTSAAVATSTTSNSYTKAILDSHNNYRALHGAGSLSWDDTMASFASGVSGKCVFAHSGGKYGENLAAGYSDEAAAIKAWYDEEKDYDYAAGQFSEATGHFTQVVWKDATKVGCATIQCNGEDGTPGAFLTCEYDTGNVIGEFVQNVLAPTTAGA